MQSLLQEKFVCMSTGEAVEPNVGSVMVMKVFIKQNFVTFFVTTLGFGFLVTTAFANSSDGDWDRLHLSEIRVRSSGYGVAAVDPLVEVAAAFRQQRRRDITEALLCSTRSQFVWELMSLALSRNQMCLYWYRNVTWATTITTSLWEFLMLMHYLRSLSSL